jgi:hypothetical protein
MIQFTALTNQQYFQMIMIEIFEEKTEEEQNGLYYLERKKKQSG